LGWAAGSAAATLTDYLNLTLHRAEEHREILRSVRFDVLVHSARRAAKLQEIASTAPLLLGRTDFSWIPNVPDRYISRIKLQVALMMDDELTRSTDNVLSNAALMAELQQAKRRTSNLRRPRRLSPVEVSTNGVIA
jgi:hypothetical protein